MPRLAPLLSPLSIVLTVSLAAAFDEPADPDVQTTLVEFVQAGEIPGAVTLVARDGDIVHLGAVGQADLESGRPMAADTIFWIASMTKPITATALLILQDEERLSVNDPVEKYIPAFADMMVAGSENPPSEQMTIRHLLTHSSGLDRISRRDGGDDRLLEQQIAELVAKPLKYEPGEKWEYGHGVTVCGRIIEIVSGQNYGDFVRERILEPLGMDDTTFHLSDAQLERLVTNYKFNEEKTELVPAMHRYVSPDSGITITPNPSGGLYATAGDMFRFYQMILNGGELDGTRIVSADAVRRMTMLQSGDLQTGFTPGNGWGLGWCIVRHPQDVTGMLSSGTFGHGGAYGTQGWVDPLRGMIFVLMIQRSDLGNSDGSAIRKEFQQAAVDAFGD